MIEKKYIKSRKTCKVIFTIPNAELPEGLEVESLSVAGTFNNWDPEATPMKQKKNGVYSAEVEVKPGEACEFRYVANGEHWFNAWEADAYTPNAFGADNCVVTTPELDQ